MQSNLAGGGSGGKSQWILNFLRREKREAEARKRESFTPKPDGLRSKGSPPLGNLTSADHHGQNFCLKAQDAVRMACRSTAELRGGGKKNKSAVIEFT